MLYWKLVISSEHTDQEVLTNERTENINDN